MPWSTLISSARLTAKTSWADIRHLVGEDIDPPYACLSPETTERLTHALAQDKTHCAGSPCGGATQKNLRSSLPFQPCRPTCSTSYVPPSSH